jgi:hypothetical protein
MPSRSRFAGPVASGKGRIVSRKRRTTGHQDGPHARPSASAGLYPDRTGLTRRRQGMPSGTGRRRQSRSCLSRHARSGSSFEPRLAICRCSTIGLKNASLDRSQTVLRNFTLLVRGRPFGTNRMARRIFWRRPSEKNRCQHVREGTPPAFRGVQRRHGDRVRVLLGLSETHW